MNQEIEDSKLRISQDEEEKSSNYGNKSVVQFKATSIQQRMNKKVTNCRRESYYG